MKYTVERADGYQLIQGGLLSELLRYVISLHIKEIERLNVLYKLDKGLYRYLNQLATIYKLAEEYAELLELNWEYVEKILAIYNQHEYIEENQFIHIKRVKEEREEVTDE